MRPRRLPLAAFAAATLIAAGCGNDRGEPPDLDHLGAARPTTEFERAGAVRFRHPRSWSARDGEPPQYASLASGGALAAIYGYPRRDLGLDSASIEASRQRLIASLRERDPGFLLERSEITEVDGSPAVEIRGRGAIGGRPVETRSIHVYKPAVEWVIDAYAQPAKFDRANRIAFGPLLASVELSDAVPGAGDEGAEG